MAFLLATPAFENGAMIPKKFTCDGPDISPPLTWTEPPKRTKSFAVIVDDPDAPSDTWVHWVLYEVPADTRELSEGVRKDRQLSNGALQGRNDFGKIGYNGPCPPKGGPHGYSSSFTPWTRGQTSRLEQSKSDLERAMKGHIL